MITTTPITGLTQTVYTSSNNSAVTFMSICNYGTATRTVDIHVVPNGYGPGADTTNIIVSQLDIVADDTYMLYGAAEKILLENGDTVVVVVDTATDITAVVSSAQV